MPVVLQTVGLLIVSNVFMTFAWYAHLKELNHKPWIVAALLSWGVALFEYLFQVPANRIGHTQFSVGQLKILQEVITLSVFVPFSALYLREPVRLDYLWAGLCLCGAVYFVFRAPAPSREVASPPGEARQVAPEHAPPPARGEDVDAFGTD
ncbi:hypothetical protein CA12_19940 [Alienimonas californiensis]|uniref:Uncharacterized protein n=1 Tax=Alienimonas californiensis TaxID=2527989 RepID=A0A517P949_9PLAN|nr:hypothetical protein CA12_19940 [Alienimonas californiensis]